MIRLFSFVAAALLWAAQPGLARDVKIGTASVKLVPPQNFCEMDEQKAGDARLLGMVQAALGGTNRLLSMQANCKQLDDWRVGRLPFLQDYVQYQTLIALVDKPLFAPPGEAIQMLCKLMRDEGDKLMSVVTPDVKTRVEALSKTIKVNEMRLVGILDEEPGVCYAGMIQSMQTEAGTQRTQLIVMGAVIAQDKVIYYYLFAPYAKPDDMTAALARHKVNVAAFRKVNKP